MRPGMIHVREASLLVIVNSPRAILVQELDPFNYRFYYKSCEDSKELKTIVDLSKWFLFERGDYGSHFIVEISSRFPVFCGAY